MKKLLCILLVCMLLTGCTLSATAPTTQPTEANQPSIERPTAPVTQPTQEPTENTGFVGQQRDWSKEEHLSLISKPADVNLYYDAPVKDINGTKITGCILPHGTGLPANWGTQVWFEGATYDGMVAYCEDLQAAGFNRYPVFQQDEKNQRFIFCGMNAQGDVVGVNYRWLELELNMYAKNVLEEYDGYITVCDMTDSSRPGTLTAWDQDAYQKLLPAPQCGYKSAEERKNEKGEVYEYYVDFSDPGLEQVLAYAQQLKDFGFNLHSVEELHPYASSYSYIAKNSEGHCVWLVYSKPLDQPDKNHMSLFLHMQDVDRVYQQCEAYTYLFPKAPVEGWYMYTTDVQGMGRNWAMVLPGVDYDQAVDLVQELKNMGYALRFVREKVENLDPVQKTLHYGAEGVIQVGNIGGYPTTRDCYMQLFYDESPEAVEKNGAACILYLENTEVEVYNAAMGKN